MNTATRRIVVAAAAALALTGCGSSSDDASLPTVLTEETVAAPGTASSGFWAPSTAPVTAGQAAQSNADVAAAAEKYVTDNLGGNPSTSSWGRYISGYSYNAGVLRVVLQVDRDSADGQWAADQAVRAIVNFIRLGSPPPELAGVNWVEVTDGSGVHITQSEVR